MYKRLSLTSKRSVVETSIGKCKIASNNNCTIFLIFNFIGKNFKFAELRYSGCLSLQLMSVLLCYEFAQWNMLRNPTFLNYPNSFLDAMHDLSFRILATPQKEAILFLQNSFTKLYQ